jgi:23S rRNA pseudouridine2605 synthase
MMNEPMVLNKYLAHAGVCSRRKAVALIEEGLIKVNGVIVQDPAYVVAPKDFVKLRNRGVHPEKKLYVLLNKPKDYVTTVEDDQGRRIVTDLVRGAGKVRWYPVGRLDIDTTGLLLMTNDGELTQKLAHPKSNVKKVYQVVLDRQIPLAELKQLKKGVLLKDGRAHVDEVAYGASKRGNVVKVTLHSGRNRIIRRMFAHIGYQVTQLDRVQYAGLTKKGLLVGRWRFLSEEEVELLNQNS